MEANNDKIDKEITSLKNIPNDKLLNQVTLRDLILFKEDILKEMRQNFSNIRTSLSDKFKKFVEDANEKLPIDLSENSQFMKRIKFIEEKNKILSTLTEKETILNEKIMVNDLHINNCQKDLNDAIFKYDRAILNNLLIPGLVGQGCKFLNFRDYMADIQGQINNAFSKLDLNGNNIYKNKKSLEDEINKANTKIKNLEYDSKQFTFEKFLELESKIKQELQTFNNNIVEITGEFYKNKVELKNQIESLKNAQKLTTEENRRINYQTLTEFEKIQKGFKYMKKTIIDLGKLLMLSDKRSKINKNFAVNKQSIIEEFNNMMLGIVKDIKRESTNSQPKEVINQKSQPKKQVKSVIKQYIEGKIQADQTNHGDTEKKERKKKNDSKDKESEEFQIRKSIKRKSYIINKDEDFNSSRLNNNNNKVGISFEKYKKFSRHASVEYREINKTNSLGSNNNESDSKKNNNNALGETNKSRHFGIIKEKKNIISGSNSNILFSDLEEDFKNLKLHEQENILNYKAFENKKFIDEDNSFLNTENSFKKFNTNKKFFRAITTNYDINKPKNLEATNQNPEKFKLLLKAQENLKKKILEKQNPKKDNVSGQTIENKLNQNKINLINQDKYSDKKLNYAQEKLSINSLNEINNQDKSNIENRNELTINSINNEKKINNNNYKSPTIKERIEIKGKPNIKNEKILNLNNENLNNVEKKEINNINKENIDNRNNRNNKINEENKKQILERINIFPKEKSLLNYKLKDNLENNSLTEKNNRYKNKINNYNNSRAHYEYKLKSSVSRNKNLSPENDKSKLVKIENNKENIRREINLSANVKNKHHNIITKYSTQFNENKNHIVNLKTVNQPVHIMKESQTKYNNKFRIQRSYNLLNEDIFVNKEDMKKINYYKDKDIIDKPLLANQLNFRVDNIKGTLENKLLELEYFTKKKFDELVREIKNFIPIHFNSYVRE